MRVALDTNVLAYAEGVNDPAKQKAALQLAERLSGASVVIPVQVLGELFRVLVGPGKRLPAEAQSAVLNWRDAFGNLADTTSEVLMAAMDLAKKKLSIWDAIILCAAADAGCRILLSEDMQDGFVWQGVTVVDPFREPRHPLLEAILDPAS